MNSGTAGVWAFVFVAAMLATCWRVPFCRARGRRCTDIVQGTCTGSQSSTWIHGDAGEETQLARPVYRYEHAGIAREVAAGVATMFFERSPAAAAMSAGRPIQLRVNPANPSEVYDPAYESWFAKYRFIWGLAAFAGSFALVNLLLAITA